MKKEVSSNFQDGKYENALRAAAYNSNHTLVQLLAEKRMDVEARDDKCGDALQLVCINGYMTVMGRLLRVIRSRSE